MALSISKRLERLKKITSQQKEVRAEKAVFLWVEFVRRAFPKDRGKKIKFPDYFSPPFRNVSHGDYERARKELETFDREVE